MNASSITCVVLYIIVALHGCSIPVTHVIENQGGGSLLEFIQDGVSTRAEILNRLGKPGTEYEDGRIIIYWIQMSEAGVFEVVPRKYFPTRNSSQINAKSTVVLRIHNLVLVFTDEDILERHSLVFMR